MYCKVHYLKLFKESGGKYDKAFGDGGFQKKATPAYTPGQFAGVGKTNGALPAHLSAAPDMSPVIAPKSKAIAVVKLSEEDEESTTEDGDVSVDSPAIGETKSSVKDIMLKYEATLRDASSAGSESDDHPSPVARKDVVIAVGSPMLQGNSENRLKWLSGVSSTHIKKHAEVDHSPGGSIAQRKAAYLARTGNAEAESALTETGFSTQTSESAPTPEATTEFPSATSPLAQATSPESVNRSLQNKQHGEVDATPGGSAQERKEAYLAAIGSNASPASSTGSASSKIVSKLVSERMKVFASPPSANSSPKTQESSPGRIDEKLKMFVEAASAVHSPATTQGGTVAVGKIDDRVKSFEEAARSTELKSPRSEDETDYKAQYTPPKVTDPSLSGSSIRSFNEGASGSLRRTPSWLRQQRAAMEEAAKSSEQASSTTATAEEFKEHVDLEKQKDTEAGFQTPVKEGEHVADSKSAEEDDEEPSTPGSEPQIAPAPPTGSIMKRTGSFKKDKDKTVTPAEKRVVRFGVAEIHELPSSPKSPDASETFRTATSHSATKGSALSMYLKNLEKNGGGGTGRKRTLEEPAAAEEHSAHADSPPPPILSPGSRSPSGPSSLANSFANVDLLNSPDETVTSGTEVIDEAKQSVVEVEVQQQKS